MWPWCCCKCRQVAPSPAKQSIGADAFNSMIKRLETIYVVSALVPGTTGEAGAPGRKENCWVVQFVLEPVMQQGRCCMPLELKLLWVQTALLCARALCFAAAAQPSAPCRRS